MRRRPAIAPPTTVARHVIAGLNKVAMTLRQETWRGATRASVSAAQAHVLTMLVGEPDLRAKDIAARLGVTAASVSDTLRSLVEKRLVARTADASDLRAVRFNLTRRGAVLARRASDWPAYLATSIDALTAEEQATLLIALTKMICQLQDDGRISVARMCATCIYFRPHAHRGVTPHHCDFVDRAFGPRDLRLDCDDHARAAADSRNGLALR